MDTEADLDFQAGRESWMKLYYMYCLHLLEQTKPSAALNGLLASTQLSVTPKVKLILNSRSKKLSLVAVKGEIILRTHSISFPGCFNANEAHLYNLSKWKTDNQTASLCIHIQRAPEVLMDADHFRRGQTGKHNISCCVTETKTLLLVSITTSVTPTGRFDCNCYSFTSVWVYFDFRKTTNFHFRMPVHLNSLNLRHSHTGPNKKWKYGIKVSTYVLRRASENEIGSMWINNFAIRLAV